MTGRKPRRSRSRTRPRRSRSRMYSRPIGPSYHASQVPSIRYSREAGPSNCAICDNFMTTGVQCERCQGWWCPECDRRLSKCPYCRAPNTGRQEETGRQGRPSFTVMIGRWTNGAIIPSQIEGPPRPMGYDESDNDEDRLTIFQVGAPFRLLSLPGMNIMGHVYVGYPNEWYPVLYDTNEGWGAHIVTGRGIYRVSLPGFSTGRHFTAANIARARGKREAILSGPWDLGSYSRNFARSVSNHLNVNSTRGNTRIL